MPGVDGLEVCRRLRAAGDRTPVLMLTARDAVGDRVAGLDAGADDYLVKPFALEELLARLRALLRRTGGARHRHAPLRRPRRSTPARARCGAASARIELTRTEFLLLELFLRNPRQVLTRSRDLRARVGLRLRAALERARGVRGLPAPQARGGRRAAPDPHRARRRLRAARAVTLPHTPRARVGRRGRRRDRGRLASLSYALVTRRSCAARSTTRSTRARARSRCRARTTPADRVRDPDAAPRRRGRLRAARHGGRQRRPPAGREDPAPVERRAPRRSPTATRDAVLRGRDGQRRRTARCSTTQYAPGSRSRSRGRSTRSTATLDRLAGS